MEIVSLKCKPFIADFIRHKFGTRIRITAKGHEMIHLKALVDTGIFFEHYRVLAEKYTDAVEIEFPNLFIWKSGRVGIPYTAIVDFNTFIRNQIADGMNQWMDVVSQTVSHKENDLIMNYLVQIAHINEENINLDTWKKIRHRYKVEQNEGPLRKKQEGKFVTENVTKSLRHANA